MPSWLDTLRKSASDRFASQGWPSLGDEEWKTTDLSPLAALSFAPAPDARPDAQTRAVLSLAPDCAELVFVNGRFAPDLSTADGLPASVQAGSLAAALAGGDAAAAQHLGRHARPEENSLVALNTAHFADGAFVRVPRETIVEKPLHLLFLNLPGAQPHAVHPRVLVLLEEDAQLTLVESHAGLGDGAYHANAVTEAALAERAVLAHVRAQEEGPHAFHTATVQASQARESTYDSLNLALGARLARTDLNVTLAGEGAECTLDGLFLGLGEQHLDNHTRIDHATPHGTSRELYKGILADRAHGVFDGKVIVRKDAQKTDARQVNRNLLLSGEAIVDSTPRLDILADDVKCSHGSTIGHLSDDALFYLRSRGLSREEARRLLVRAFAGELLQKINVAPLRERLERAVLAWLPGEQAAVRA
jgi:Fe-S cluster assembly protein SufD